MLRQPAFFIHINISAEIESTLVTHSQQTSSFLLIISLQRLLTLSGFSVNVSSKKLKWFTPNSLCSISISLTTFSALLSLHCPCQYLVTEQYRQLKGHPLLAIRLQLFNSLTFFPLNLIGEE